MHGGKGNPSMEEIPRGARERLAGFVSHNFYPSVSHIHTFTRSTCSSFFYLNSNKGTEPFLPALRQSTFHFCFFLLGWVSYSTK